MNKKNLSSGFIALVFVAGIVLGCSGGKTCTGELNMNGRVYTGTDPWPDQAKRNACNGYCVEGNAKFDEMFRAWLETPESKKVADRENKWSGYHADPKLRTFVTNCIEECFYNVGGGYKLSVDCK